MPFCRWGKDRHTLIVSKISIPKWVKLLVSFETGILQYSRFYSNDLNNQTVHRQFNNIPKRQDRVKIRWTPRRDVQKVVQDRSRDQDWSWVLQHCFVYIQHRTFCLMSKTEINHLVHDVSLVRQLEKLWCLIKITLIIIYILFFYSVTI